MEGLFLSIWIRTWLNFTSLLCTIDRLPLTVEGGLLGDAAQPDPGPNRVPHLEAYVNILSRNY